MEPKTLEKFVEELAEKIYSCEGATGIKLLADKLNELSEKYNQKMISSEKKKFNKAVYDAYCAFYKATKEESLTLRLQSENTDNECVFDITDIGYCGSDGRLTLYYNDD